MTGCAAYTDEKNEINAGEKQMTLYEELKARGLIAQVTNEEEISEMITTARPRFTLALTRRRTACMSVTSWRCA